MSSVVGFQAEVDFFLGRNPDPSEAPHHGHELYESEFFLQPTVIPAAHPDKANKHKNFNCASAGKKTMLQ